MTPDEMLARIAEARGYRRGIEEAEKKCAAIAGDPRMYDAERRRGSGMCQAAIRALGEGG